MVLITGYEKYKNCKDFFFPTVAGAGSRFGRAAELRGKCRGGLLPHLPGKFMVQDKALLILELRNSLYKASTQLVKQCLETNTKLTQIMSAFILC